MAQTMTYRLAAMPAAQVIKESEREAESKRDRQRERERGRGNAYMRLHFA